MKKRVYQRNNYDCAVCCLAMATGELYETILAHVPTPSLRRISEIGLDQYDDISVLKSLDIDFKDYPKADANYGIMLLRRGIKAILTVKSKNYPELLHATYWDGENIIDPSRNKTYTNQDMPYIMANAIHKIEIGPFPEVKCKNRR